LMPAVYVLQSESSGRFYIGSAQNLSSRLAEHNRSHSPYTRNRGPWVLKYSEDFQILAEARRRELQIKSWKSHRSVQELIDRSSGQTNTQSGHEPLKIP
jgi:putative endonuclease